MPNNTSSYTGGHFELHVDGAQSSAYLRQVEGGHIKQEVVSEQVGADRLRVKHNTVTEIEPFTLEVGMSGAGDVLRWIRESWRGAQYQHRNGQITHANFDHKQTFTHEFREALVMETTFPELDGSSKQAAYLKVKMLPAHVNTQLKYSETRVGAAVSPKQKLWTASSFRLSLDGIKGLDWVNKIEAFTIKQNVKMMHTGADRYPEIIPTNIEFPNLKGTISMAHADDLAAWHKRYIVNGGADPKQQTTGMIEFLAPNKKDVIFTIQLYDVGIQKFSVEPVKANQESVKRFQFELYVGRMDITGTHLGIA